MRYILSFAAIVIIGAFAVHDTWYAESDNPQQVGTPLTQALGEGENGGWERVTQVRKFQFPKDHGPHESYKTEWWYFTGNLETGSGQQFGYQLTIFRIGLSPEKVQDESLWRANQLYMAHFAITDVQGDKFYHFERFSRAANDLAGAQAKPFKVWLENWKISAEEEFFPLKITAEEKGVALSLTLKNSKRVVLQGDRGLSQKSSERGNASYYYSFTRMPTQGEITIHGKQYYVTGESWFDREWSTSALSSEQQGWDWFSLQLSNGYELMYYRLRRKEGGSDVHSAGVLVGPAGIVTKLSPRQVELKVLDSWTSDESGVSYPVSWQMQSHAPALNLKIEPLLENQEMNLSVRYWEGAISVSGKFGNEQVSGRGYLELAGYE